MEVLRVRGDRLVPPLQTRRQEPRERQDHPPHRGRHSEEIDHEEDGHAGFRSLGPRLERRSVAGDLLVAEHAPRQVADRDGEVAGRQEHYRSLRILEALGVDQKRGDGHEGACGAQAAPQSQPHGREPSFFGGEERPVARERAIRYSCNVLNDVPGDAYRGRRYDPTYGHACQPSPAAYASGAAAAYRSRNDRAPRPQGYEGWPAPAHAIPRPFPRGMLAVFLIFPWPAPRRLGRLGRPGRARLCRGQRRAARRSSVPGSSVPGAARMIVLLHAQILRVTVGRQSLARHPLRPRETVLLHQRRATGPRPLAHASASRQGFRVFRQAYRRVHGAQEKLEVGGTFDLDQRPELVHLEPGFFLIVVIQFVGHRRQVVPDPATHRDRDLLATPVPIHSRPAAAKGRVSNAAAPTAPDHAVPGPCHAAGRRATARYAAHHRRRGGGGGGGGGRRGTARYRAHVAHRIDRRF